MNKPLHRFIMALVAAYLLAVVLIVFWPTPVDRPAAGTLHEVLSWLYRHGMPRFINYNVVEFSANIVMFVPLGIIASAVFKNAAVGFVLGALTSCLIELAQALLLPDRFASGLDVLANTFGAGLGALIYLLLAALWPHFIPATRVRSVSVGADRDAPSSDRAADGEFTRIG